MKIRAHSIRSKKKIATAIEVQLDHRIVVAIVSVVAVHSMPGLF